MQQGPARRLAEAFTSLGGTPIIAGGKTGSGDNRFKSFEPSTALLPLPFMSAIVYFGVISASVLGKQAENYRFTSALPVAILKLLAPALNERLASHKRLPA